MANAAYIQGKIFYGYGQAAKRLGRNYSIYRATTAINPITTPDYHISDILAGLDDNYTYTKAIKFGDKAFWLLADANSNISDFVITNPGSGYILPPYVQFIGGNGSGAQAVATIDLIIGTITGITLTNPGTGYSMAPTINLIGGIYETKATVTCSITPGLQPFDYLVLNDTTLPDYFDESIFYVTSIFPLLPMTAQLCNRMVSIYRPDDGTSPGANYNYAGFDQTRVITLYQNCPISMLENSKGEMSPLKFPLSVKQPFFRIFMPILGNVDIKIGDLIIDQEDERFYITSAELTEMGWRLIAGTVGV